MTLQSLNLMPALPEIFLLCAVSAILILDLFISDRNRAYTYLLSLLALAACAGITLGSHSGEIAFAFNGMFVEEQKAAFVAGNGNATRIDLAGASHDAHLDAFDALVAALTSFLK